MSEPIPDWCIDAAQDYLDNLPDEGGTLEVEDLALVIAKHAPKTATPKAPNGDPDNDTLWGV